MSPITLLTKYLFHRKVRNSDKSITFTQKDECGFLLPTGGDIATHFAETSAAQPFSVPDSIVDEVLEACDRLGVSPMPGNADVAFPEPTR